MNMLPSKLMTDKSMKMLTEMIRLIVMSLQKKMKMIGCQSALIQAKRKPKCQLLLLHRLRMKWIR